MEEYQEFSPVFAEDVYAAISLENCLAGRTSYGGPTGESVFGASAAGLGRNFRINKFCYI